ncbi:TPA: hypothetical protein DIT45_03220 [Candidatus Acetothermia bacterium]|nr:hypothetical protein [Candidatus Acetothermia bacterium]
MRNTFISGLLAIIPVGATFYILWFIYHLIDGLVGRETPFGTMVKTALGRWIPGMGIYMTVILVLLVGFITRNFLGRTLQYYMDRAFSSVPGVRKMYSTLKKFTTALLDRDTSSFQKVVMFEYPKEGINVIGLVTNEELGMLQDATGEECLLVYVPTAPNPLSGMMLIIPEREVTYLDMPVEDALSMVISSGSVLPKSLKTVNKEERRPRFSLFRRR